MAGRVGGSTAWTTTRATVGMSRPNRSPHPVESAGHAMCCRSGGRLPGSRRVWGCTVILFGAEAAAAI